MDRVLYALGCVGYALTTGRRPFDGSSPAELCNAHLSRPVMPPSRRLNRAVDPSLERVILACLAKRPVERPQSAGEIVALVERSPLALAWTRDDADTFWATHRSRINDIVSLRGQRAAAASEWES